jgi:hypothetical protein
MVQVFRRGMAVLAATTVLLAVATKRVASDDDPIPDVEAYLGSWIQLNVSPCGPTTMYINESQEYTATATQWDSYLTTASQVYTYSSDISSGTSSSDYHIWWTATFNDAPIGSFSNLYGPTSTFIAPDYSEGEDERSVSVIAHLRGNQDVLAMGPSPATGSVRRVNVADVLQIKVTHNQTHVQNGAHPWDVQGHYGKAGTVQAATDTTFTDNLRTEAADAWKDFGVIIETGTGANHIRKIASNTANGVFTITPQWSTNPVATSTYRVGWPPPRVGGGQLGWLTPGAGVDAGSLGYKGATEAKATQLAAGPGFFRGVGFAQKVYGTEGYKIANAWTYEVITGTEMNNVDAEHAALDYFVGDNDEMEDKNGGETPAYHFDAPAVNVGLSNDIGISEGKTDWVFHPSFLTSVLTRTGGTRVSNVDTWSVTFDLHSNGSTWTLVNDSHQP